MGNGPFPDLTADELAKLRGDRPTARKLHGWIYCTAPVPGGQMLVHGYQSLPKGAALGDLIHYVETAARTAVPDENIAGKFGAASLFLAQLPAKKRLGQLLFALRDQGLTGIVAMAHIRQGKVKKTYFASQEDRKIKDDFATILAQGEDTSLDLELTAAKLGGQTANLLRPPDSQNGLAFLGVDLAPAILASLTDAQDHFHLLTDDTHKRKFTGIAALAAIFIGAAIYLAMPAPVYVSNFAESRARQSITMALPFGAFLETTNVRPGQLLEAGDVAAVLRSPELENGIAEQKVAYNLEVINGQDALNSGNIGALQLAEKRAEIAQLRQRQLESRQALLTVTAPTASRVVTALPDGDRGNFMPIGTAIVTLQPTQAFDLVIDIAPQDSVRVIPGQTGHVFFRGLSDETFGFEILSTPTQTLHPETNEMRHQVRARITDAQQSDLLVGLSGFAKIETRTAPRIVGLTRPVVDYVRLFLWKNLGFTF